MVYALKPGPAVFCFVFSFEFETYFFPYTTIYSRCWLQKTMFARLQQRLTVDSDQKIKQEEEDIFIAKCNYVNHQQSTTCY